MNDQIIAQLPTFALMVLLRILQPSRVNFPLYDRGEWYIVEGEQIYCAKISRDGEWEDSVLQWLVLKCIGADMHVYERIGLTIGGNTCWPCTESRKRIKIV